jgi:membrane protein
MDKILTKYFKIKFFNDPKVNRIMYLNAADLFTDLILMLVLSKLYGTYLPLLWIGIKNFLVDFIGIFNSTIIKFFNLKKIMFYIIILTIIEGINLSFIIYYYNIDITNLIILHSVLTIIGSILFKLKVQRESEFIESRVKYSEFLTSSKTITSITLVTIGLINIIITSIFEIYYVLIIGVFLHLINLKNFINYYKILVH